MTNANTKMIFLLGMYFLAMAEVPVFAILSHIVSVRCRSGLVPPTPVLEQVPTNTDRDHANDLTSIFCVQL